jgi:phenylacetate-CoA ligase
MSTYAWAYEHLLFAPWQSIVRGRPIRDHLAFLETTQWLPRASIARMQLASLQALLAHAGRNVPYWRELFRSTGFDPLGVRSVDDLRALPVLTRAIMQERHDDLIDPALRATNVRKGTSGSTGVPLRFEYCNQSEAWRQATRLRGWGWAGWRIGERTVYYWGAGPAPATGWVARKIQLDRALKRELYVDAIHQDDASMRSFAETLARFRPAAIVAYTQALVGFARWVGDNGARDWPDVRVVCAAESVLPHDREALVAAFGPQVFETYGSRETMLVAAECEEHRGMHLSEENLLVEILHDGRSVGPGESGDVVVTDLHNYGMPFIRYANGDVATLAQDDEACPCGRSLRKLARVEGRIADTMRDAAGGPVPGMLFVTVLQEARMNAFQATQLRSGAVDLKVVRGRDWDEARFQATIRRAQAYFKGFPIRVTYCDAIPAGPSGKRQPIVVEH